MDGAAATEPEPSISAAHSLAAHEVEQRLASDPRGLAADEAAQRLRRYGPNRLREAPPTSPLINILLVAAVITVLIEHYVDAAVIAAVLVLNAVIGFAQEHQAERSVRALMQFADACRRGAAGRVIAVVPYFGDARGDRRAGERRPIMASLVARLLESTT